ncbi:MULTISPECIES: glutathione S-transferase C-terminal domain-containing protein [unclassified Enterococcus]|uniref:glutathione S-transferase family protein n=1 Tax=unclassified Enterococcus TaxID=2608891 RepID=UPI001552E72E|nr:MULTISPECIES: glutathione S-transferase C-terminal domain-containing protein [unclassified Enterococcus]MBS7576587.1 glutathione S-transferase C-terminal domain-containing protein [Enterococcus sp. MMGLQ5-2]MBS7583926.1 glutathione S-transferase C-terminal domain-containing protein [Enterococcus sp. MMGLQ5-1]NPD11787.1 glutathione S-transferase family protein [Enterococcus sp. MMGLQ5-1]NPD36424.1 glutathione S-transferase family protein [Enterococcus sp. MMGLQ5-2]
MVENKVSQSIEIAKDGRFIRQTNQFIAKFGDGADELPVIANKYRLLWAPVCPWAHRAVIVRKVLGLEKVISLGTADPIRPKLEHTDWSFTLDEGDVDPVLGIHYLSEVYLNADPEYTKRPTVPALIDIESKKVVENDYHNLTYYFERDWKKFHKKDAPDLFPVELEAQIRQLNDIIFHEINNGVYKAGFAKSQAAYEAAYDTVFERLDWLDKRLANQRYLHGNQLTDSDVRLYSTLARFDVAYYAAFNVNKKRLIDYPNLWGYARDLYQTYGFGDTTDFAAIKKHYFLSIHLKPQESHQKILPKGPDVSVWLEPSDRVTKFS